MAEEIRRLEVNEQKVEAAGEEKNLHPSDNSTSLSEGEAKKTKENKMIEEEDEDSTVQIEICGEENPKEEPKGVFKMVMEKLSGQMF